MRAFVEEVVSPHKVKVRIPIINKIEGVNGATPVDELYYSCVCTPPGMTEDIVAGDVVILGFEENDYARPILLGFLSMDNDMQQSHTDMCCGDLVAKGTVSFGDQVQIGNLNYANLETLIGQKDNIKDTFATISTDIENLKTDVSSANSTLSTMTTDMGSINADISALSLRVKELESQYMSLLVTLTDYVKKYPAVFSSGTYGESVTNVTEPQEGQVFFAIKSDT